MVSVLREPIAGPHSHSAMAQLTPAQKRQLKSQAQLLKPALKLGKLGLTADFMKMVDATLLHKPLLKIRLESFKEERHELGVRLAEQSGSHLVTVIGNVIVLYRPGTTAEHRDETASPSGPENTETR